VAASSTLGPPAAAGTSPWLLAAARHRFPLAAAVLLLLPAVVPFTALATSILVYGLYALGFDLMFGYLGALSFGHAALFGAGAYACGIALATLGWPWWLALAAGTAGGLAMAAVLGAVAIRARGISFSMVTLALAQCVYYAFYQAADVTGGENGLMLPALGRVRVLGFALDGEAPLTRYYLVAAFVILALFVLSRILASPFGAALEAVRENEARARASGYDVAATRLLAFALSGAFCGLAGALQALQLSIVPIETLSIDTSGLAVMMCLLGGAGTYFGPFVGAAAFLLLEALVSVWTVHWQLAVGAAFVACVLFLRRGLWGSVVAGLGR
jgi:branched-chain amino acid transport system permease protein